MCDTPSHPDNGAGSFELRFFSSDPQANGETDFKGGASVLSTPDRIRYLETYADVACRLFDDPELNQPAVPPAALTEAVSRLKPPPLPSVRNRVSLSEWRWQAFPPIPDPPPDPPIPDGILAQDNRLEWQTAAEYVVAFPAQAWRAFFWFSLILPDREEASVLEIGDIATIELQRHCPARVHGKPCGGALQPGTPLEVKIEADYVSEGGRFNLRINGGHVAEWEPMRSTAPCDRVHIAGATGLRLLRCRGLGFDPTPPPGRSPQPDQPYFFHPLFHLDFHDVTPMLGWEQPGFDDAPWRRTGLPCLHGGCLEAGEDLALRARIELPAFAKATLHFESIDPGGEVWINGRIVWRQHGPHAVRLDATPWLIPGAVNTLAVRVDARKVKIRMRHTCTDRHTGWFLGRAWLDLHADRYLEELFVYTKETDDPAILHWQVDVQNRQWGEEEGEARAALYSAGEVRLELSPWFPEAGPVAAVASVPVKVNYGQTVVAQGEIELPAPKLWTVETPHLYRARAVLLDEQGREVDDVAIATGVRTVSQEGGVFRINRKPAMMNGALLFGTRPPIEEQARRLRCGTQEELVRDILAVRALGGNTIRMSVHDSPYGGINDPRLAEIGDQIGMLFQWTTNEWVRTSSPWQLSFPLLARDIRQVRNHPSIVLWQPGNHPKFDDWQHEGADWFARVVETVAQVDPSRLISPTANFDQLHAPSDDGTLDRNRRPVAPSPAWRHPLTVRGNMETPTGYAQEWSVLRTWPRPSEWSGEQGWIRTGFREQYLGSDRHAYFDFESEESAAQPNWALHRGQPYYRLRSYEVGYDKGSIGRETTLDEWRISQAWQAFSAYEAYRKKRCLDYDGMAWCTLDGGGNSGTYEKPLTDALGNMKLAFHTVRMAFQPVLAGSRDVDLVYGPEDAIRPVVLNIGPERMVEITVRVATPAGRILAESVYAGVRLPAGRTRVDLAPWPRPNLEDGLYVVHYQVDPTGRD